jgi:hypothetical protein
LAAKFSLGKLRGGFKFTLFIGVGRKSAHTLPAAGETPLAPMAAACPAISGKVINSRRRLMQGAKRK